MEVNIDSMAWVPKENFTDTDLFMLKRNLTILPKTTSEYKKPSPIELFVLRDNCLGIPREYYKKIKIRNRFPQVENDLTTLGLPLNEEISTIKLRPYQREADSVVYRYLKEHYGCCVHAETAWGKTVFALNMARKLGRKTLIIVHKTTLAKQWETRIKGDPNEEGILKRGFLPEARVGFVGDGKLNYKDCDFVIALVQSLAEKELPDDFFDQFGSIIIDEIHRMGSEKWGKAVPRFPARYRLGLTATPRRKDHAENVFFYSVGPIVYRGQGQVLKPTVYLLETNFAIIESRGIDLYNLKRNQFLDIITKDEQRNRLIAKELFNALCRKRRVLCVSDRVEHLKTLMKELTEIMRRENKFFTMGEFFKGGRKLTAYELDYSKRQNCVFGTYKLIEDGEDVPELDTLVMATPISDAEQVVGRILRKRPNKLSAIVVDIRDDRIPRCQGMGNNRIRLYLNKKWKVYAVKK